jgi:hypothetical protein
MASPNRLAVDAFKPVVDAALHFDGLYLPDYGEVPEPLTHEESELLADYVEKRVSELHDDLEVPVSFAALASILAPTGHFTAVLGVLKERCGGGA